MSWTRYLEERTHPQVAAWLRAIRLGESHPELDEAYTALFGWRPGNGKVFTGWDDHPRVRTYEVRDEFIANGKRDFTTAAGAHQITMTTWDGVCRRLGKAPFDPPHQDAAAVFLTLERDALADVKAGRIDRACAKCNGVWASLPGANTPQPQKSLAAVTAAFTKYGGVLHGQPTEPPPKPPEPAAADPFAFDPDSLATEHYEGPEPYRYTPHAPPKTTEVPMAGFAIPILKVLAAFGPDLVRLVPQLGSLLGSGSEVATRNVQAATALLDTVVKAADSPNLQAAVERMVEDPTVRTTVQAAVASSPAWELVEVGGGIPAARTAAAPFMQSEWWRFLVVPQTWFGLLLLGLVYLAMGNVTGLWGYQEWTPELRSNVVFAIVGVAIGSVSGYYFGTSSGSQRKDELRSASK